MSSVAHSPSPGADDDRDDDDATTALAYVLVYVLVIGCSLLIAALLWIARWLGGMP